MERLRINKMIARYHIPQNSPGMLERLEKMLDTIINEYLDIALDQAGISPHDEICIRQVYAPIRLRFSDPDSALISKWSEALAEFIRKAIKNGAEDSVVRFSSRFNGLLDFALGVANGNYRRVWGMEPDWFDQTAGKYN